MGMEALGWFLIGIALGISAVALGGLLYMTWLAIFRRKR